MQDIKVIFIPGNGGDGSTLYGWFSYLKKELESMGLVVIAPNFPDGILARKHLWLPFIESLGTDENTILIGHSSGAIASMCYAENHKILGSVIVAGYHTDLNLDSEKQSGYFDKPWDWDSIKNNQKWIIQYNSIDDPFIPIQEARFVKDKLNSEYFELHQGHFYPKAEFPEIVEVIKEKLK